MKSEKLINELSKQVPRGLAWYEETPEAYAESSKYLVAFEDYLKAMRDRGELVCDKLLDDDELFDKFGEDYKGDNTYNYSGNIDHELDVKIFDKGYDGYIVAVRVHKSGDVRCNYTDYIVFKFDSFEDWAETEYDLDNSFELQVKGKVYNITPRVWCEWYDVWGDDDSFEVVPNDITDKEMKLAIEKMVEE